MTSVTLPTDDDDDHAPSITGRSPEVIGREREVRLLLDLIARRDVRLITLSGPGGAGKTRLVVHVAELVTNEFQAGVWLIPLSTFQNHELVIPTIAEAVASDVPDPSVDAATTVNARLAGRRGLVVLDNAEHVIGSATALANLLAHCPDLTVVATSRERFRITGEHVFIVPPLALPPAEARQLDAIAASEAVRLFVDRAQAVAPTFQLTTDNAPVIAEICRKLDGLPLALELAAARVDVLSPAALLARLERRLVLLTGGRRDQPERLRTMRNAISWSHDQLTPPEQVLFRRLAVFSGGFSLEAAEEICASRPEDRSAEGPHIDATDVLDGIVSLVEKSLVRPYDGANDERRFRMLETISDFAGEQLDVAGERTAIIARLSGWVAALAEQAHIGLRGADQARWLATLDAEAGNVRVALAATCGDDAKARPGNAASSSFDPVLILRLTGYLWRYWALRGRRQEGHDWLIRALGTPGIESAPLDDHARSSLILGNFQRAIGNIAGARLAYETALALWQEDDDPEGVADAKTNLALLAIVGGDYATAHALLDETLLLRQRKPFPYSIALTIATMAEVAVLEEDLDRAERLGHEAIAIREQIGDPSGIAFSRQLLAEIAFQRGQLATAQRLIDECLRVFSQIEDQIGLSVSYRLVGHIAASEDGPTRPQRAAIAYRAALAERVATDDRVGIVECLLDIAWLASWSTESTVQAADTANGLETIVATIEDYFQRFVMVPTPFDRPRLEATRAFLGTARLARRDDPAAAITLEMAADRAMGLISGFVGAAAPPRFEPSSHTAPARTEALDVTLVETMERGGAGNGAMAESAPVRLTRRERQVLTLIASGRLDRQIADELFISHRTVTTHVTSILAKMSVTSRTAAAATAVRLGMV